MAKKKTVPTAITETFQIGDKVTLKLGKVFTTTDPNPPTFAGRRVVKAKIETLENGVAILDVKLGGFWVWDINELEKV